MGNIEIKHNLTSTDFRLYEFLKKQDPNEWVTQKEIALALPDVFPYTIDDMQDFHNSRCRHSITDAIRNLNESGYIHKIILSGSQGVKIATEEEFNRYIGSHINATVNRLKRLKKLANKGNTHNQYRLKLSEYQQDIVNAFIDDVSNDRIL